MLKGPYFGLPSACREGDKRRKPSPKFNLFMSSKKRYVIAVKQTGLLSNVGLEKETKKGRRRKNMKHQHIVTS